MGENGSLTWDTAVFDSLLDQFSSLSGAPDMRPPTFMEVAGIGHREVYITQIMGFLLDPDSPHGLGALWSDALLRSAGAQPDTSNGGGSVVGVECEADTREGKWIDILIELENRLVVVENKIRASVYNPLDEYREHALQQGYPMEPLCIVLSLHDESANSHLADCGFVNVTYERLFHEVRAAMGDHLADARAEWVVFMLDFMKTIERQGEDVPFDRRWDELLRDHHEAALGFLEWRPEYSKAVCRQLESLLADSAMPYEDLLAGYDYNTFAWSNKKTFYVCHCVDIKLPEPHLIRSELGKDTLTVETWRTIEEGWVVTLFVRNADADESASVLKELLKDTDAPDAEAGRYHGIAFRDYIQVSGAPYDASDEDIREAVKRGIEIAKQVVDVPPREETA